VSERIEAYADACLAVARAEGQLDAIEDDLFRFSRTLEGSDALRTALTDPSLPASRRIAVVEELMGGKAVPFPPNPGSFFALQLDEHGSGVEVYPAGTELQPGGSDGGGFVKKPEARGFGPTHFALSVATDADKVEAIAAREGWQCFRCNRGPFHVIEVWVENETMVEILPPEYAAEYLAFTRPDNIAAAMAAAAPQASRQRPA